jgi:hypothetical protein
LCCTVYEIGIEKSHNIVRHFFNWCHNMSTPTEMNPGEVKASLLKCKELANAACNFDDHGDLDHAIRNYDNAIIVIDDVLTKIPSSCDAWQLLMIYREKYSSRMVSCSFCNNHDVNLIPGENKIR